MLSSRAAPTIDQATVACLRIDLYMTLDRSDRAVDVGLTYLRHLGVEWSAQPSGQRSRGSTRLGAADVWAPSASAATPICACCSFTGRRRERDISGKNHRATGEGAAEFRGTATKSLPEFRGAQIPPRNSSGSAVRIYVRIPWSLCDLALILQARQPVNCARSLEGLLVALVSSRSLFTFVSRLFISELTTAVRGNARTPL
jgi:hypothetical protein